MPIPGVDPGRSESSLRQASSDKPPRIIWETSPRVHGTIPNALLQDIQENSCLRRLHHRNSRRQRIRRTSHNQLLPILSFTSTDSTEPHQSPAQEHHPVYRSHRILHHYESVRLQRIHSNELSRDLQDRQGQYHNRPWREPSQPFRIYHPATKQKCSNIISASF